MNALSSLAAGAIGAGVSNASPVDLAGWSTLTRASSRKIAAAASPNPSANQFGRKLRRFGNTPAVAVPRPATSARPTSIRAARSGEAGRGRSFFNSASSSEKSFMGDKILFQSGKRVAITRGRRVLRNPQRFSDLREGQLVPDFHDQHLPLFHWQKIERGSQLALRAIVEI